MSYTCSQSAIFVSFVNNRTLIFNFLKKLFQ